MRLTHFVAITSLSALAACASSGASGSPVLRGSPADAVLIGGSTGVNSGATLIGGGSSSVEKVGGTVPFDATDAWRVLPLVFDSLAIPVTLRDPETRTLGNQGFAVRNRLGAVSAARLFDCGMQQGAPNASTWELHVAIITTVEPAGAAAARILTSVDVRGRPAALGGSYNHCSSKGLLEQRIAEQVAQRLRR